MANITTTPTVRPPAPAADDAARAGRSVCVTAPARLHLGFVDLNGSLGRKFGSIGLAVDQPATVLTVTRASDFSATGPDADRALRAARRYGEAFAPGAAFHVAVDATIPAHAGLGSGTQLALAVGAAIVRLASSTDPSRQDGARLGAMAERGARSAIGIAAFTGGGFIIDAGKSLKPPRLEVPPAVLMQIAFPESWRAILVLDARVEGVHGEAETAAFARLPEFPVASAAHIAHLVMMQLAPGLHEHDLAAFGAALTEIQAIVGGHFAGAQGGSAWSSPAVGRLVVKLAAAGATGIGQSSWGPTGFAFVESEAAANRLYHSFVEEAKALGLTLKIVSGRNTGARIDDLGA
jgi:beta-RFAP synthase